MAISPRFPKGPVDPANQQPLAATPTSASGPRKAGRVGALDKLGVDAKVSVGPMGLGKSRINQVLGAARLHPVRAVNVPGTVVWFNFELGRTLGFDVPADNQMTPELHAQLNRALSYRVLQEGETPDKSKTVTLHADRYGGTGMGDDERASAGAGRAAFLPWGNLNIKGVPTGLSPFDAEDFIHSHGGAPMREGGLEAIWGEVNANLFSQGSTRVLAVIDVGDATVWPNGEREKRTLIIRAGKQLRPAHWMDGFFETGKFTLEVFLRAAGESGVLKSRTLAGERVPDLAATMREIAQRHARTEAESFRWRILHGSISTSNLSLDGSQIDLATESAQPRTAKIKTLSSGGDFGREHLDRAEELQWSYDAVREALNPKQLARYNAEELNVRAEILEAYRAEMKVQLLRAMGLKAEVALEVCDDDECVDALEDLTRVFLRLARLRNPGDALADQADPLELGTVDVFNVLRRLPRDYFKAQRQDLTSRVVDLLCANIVAPTPGKKGPSVEARRQRISELAEAFVRHYDEVMKAAQTRWASHYDSLSGMRQAVISRAGFENAPLDQLYRARLNRALVDAIDTYEATQDPRELGRVVDKTVALSLRDVEQLLRQGERRRLDENVLESGIRTIDGVRYSVMSWPNGKRRVNVSLTAQGGSDGAYALSLPGKLTGNEVSSSLTLSHTDLKALRYRYTADGWETTREANAQLVEGKKGALEVHFEIPAVRSEVQRLEGCFYTATANQVWLKDGSSNLRGYTFAVPDNQELALLLNETR